MKVKDLMTADVRSLLPESSAKIAFYTLINQQISGLPVIESNGELAGMLTEKDILKYILPSYISQVGKFTYGSTPKAMLYRIQDLENMKVKDIMRKETAVISGDADLAEAAHLMLTQQVRRVPVLKDKKVIGIISRGDILRAFANEAGLLRRENE